MTCRRRLCTTTLTLLTLLFVLGPRVCAQEPAPTPQTTPEPQTVKLKFLAYDKKGHVTALKREDVHVYVDGVEQPVKDFAVAVSPASYGLVVDNSGSLRSQIGAVIVAAKSLVYNNGPADETFVVRFVNSDEIKIMQDMTSDKAELAKVLDDMYVQIGQTALLDAVYLSAEHLAKKARADEGVERRRALLLITDGEDRSSYYKVDEVLKLLRGKDVQVFAIGLTAALDSDRAFIGASKRYKAKGLLEKLTSETGGRVFFAETVGELQEAILDINKNLHTQYLLGYAPPAPGGRKHKVEVKAFGPNGTDALKVVLRPEPAAPEAPGDKKKKN